MDYEWPQPQPETARPGFDLPPVPEHPTIADISAATELLKEAVCDFPSIALILLPFVRESIDSSTPLHLFDATTPASGKGLLADCCSVIATGREAGKGPAPTHLPPARKYVNAFLCEACRDIPR